MEKKQKNYVKIILIVLSVLIVTMAALLWYIYPSGAVVRGVRAGSYDLSGLTVSDAEALIGKIDALDEQAIVLLDETGAKKEFSGLEIMLTRDVKKTVENAYNLGRGKGLANDFVSRLKLFVKPYDVGFSYSYDDEKLEKIIYDFGVSVNGEMTDYTVEYRGGYAEVSTGKPGQARDVSAEFSEVKNAIDSGVYNIDVKMKKAEPPVPTAKGLAEYIYLAPQDATYSVVDGVVTITDEVYGRSINEEEATEKIEKLASGETIRLKLNEIRPDMTKKDLYDKLFNHTLGSFSSKYSTGNKNRSQNVTLSSKLINGIILAPGETFSYNDAVGPRTAARGFKEAPIYSNGESVSGIGGGICQVSSTLYSAVLYSDLEIVQRQNHSMTVDYMPNGQDATVSYGTIDFRFRNNTENPVKISSVASDGRVTVSILGTKPERNREVKITNKTVSVIEKTVETVEDSALSPGETKTISVGKTGYVVDTYKKVYEDGVEVKNEYVGRSRYKMVPQKKAVGKAVTTPPTEPAEPVVKPKNEEIQTESEDADMAKETQEPIDTEEKEETEEVRERPEPNL